MSLPWIANAQTVIPAWDVVHNPPTHDLGLLGRVTLPYTVPAGRVLHLKRCMIEAHWAAAIIIWIGPGPHTVANSLGTYASGWRYIGTDAEKYTMMQPTLEWAMDYYIPAGVIVNVRLSAGIQPSPGWVYGWEVTGELLDAAAL